MADDEPGTLNRWTALYKDVLKPEAERCGREVGDVRGDRTLLEFEQVADAQEWSRLAHRAAAATGIGGTALRVAIHQGTVFSTREGLFGDAVNIAALFFARALEACPNHAFSWMLSSTTLSFMGRAEEALARARHALVLWPQDQSRYLYLAWAIGTSGKVEEGKRNSRPLTFVEGAAFQWINAKGWIIALGAITTYAALASFPLNVVLLSGAFVLLGTASSATWAAFGSGLRRFLKDPRHVRAFNITMALLLVASLYPVFAEAWQ